MKRIRECVVSREHPDGTQMILVAVDYSGQELRITPNQTREPLWIAEFFRCSKCGMTFDQGDGKSTPRPPPPFCPTCGSDKIGDLHTLTTQVIFGKNVVNEPGFKLKRNKTKGVNFGIVYGGGPQAVQAAVGVSKEEGARIKRLFDETYKGLSRGQKRQVNFAKKFGYAVTAFGRRCPLPDIHLPRRDPETGRPNFMFISKALRNAVNHPVQGTGGDIGKLAMALVYKLARKRKWIERGFLHMPITIHDELVFEIHPSIIAEALPLIVENMAWETVKKLRWPVPLTVDVEAGFNWSVPWNITECQHGKSVFPPELKPYFPEVEAPEPSDTPSVVEEMAIGDEEIPPEGPSVKKGDSLVLFIPRDKMKASFMYALADLIIEKQGRGTVPLALRSEEGASLLDREVRVGIVEFTEAFEELLSR